MKKHGRPRRGRGRGRWRRVERFLPSNSLSTLRLPRASIGSSGSEPPPRKFLPLFFLPLSPFLPSLFFPYFSPFCFFFPRFLFIKILIADWKISFRDERGWRKRFALENNIEWDRNVFHLSDEVDWFDWIMYSKIWMRNFTSVEQLGRTLIFKKTSPRYYIYYIVEFIITVSTMLERKNRIGHIIAWSVAISIGADWTASSNEILRIFLISSDYKSIELLLPISNDS